MYCMGLCHFFMEAVCFLSHWENFSTLSKVYSINTLASIKIQQVRTDKETFNQVQGGAIVTYCPCPWWAAFCSWAITIKRSNCTIETCLWYGNFIYYWINNQLLLGAVPMLRLHQQINEKYFSFYHHITTLENTDACQKKIP